jgi:alpha-1,2-mannosyltransferase
MHLVLRLDRLLNARRLDYAWIVGGFMWLGWLLSVLLGPGNRDLNGQLIGVDFLAFYTGGEILERGESANLYDLDFQQRLQQQLIGGEWTDLEAFVNPPFYAWFAVPLASLPYVAAYALWALLSLLGLWISLRALGVQDSRRAFAWSLTWYPVFATISFGQNSLFSLLLFSLVYWLWRKERSWAAGLVASLLLFKPQWVIGLGIMWLLEWRRDQAALLGLALGAITLGASSFWQLPDATQAYLDLTRNVLPAWQTQPGYQLYHLHTVRGFWLLLLPHHQGWADAISFSLMAVGLLGFVFFWRRYRQQRTLLFAGMICFTLWINPHAMIYDWTVLLIPALLLWQHVPNLRIGWKVLYASIWLVTFLSSLLTFVQLQWSPFAVQISVPVYGLVVYVGYSWLRDPPSFDINAPRASGSDSAVGT